MRHPGETTSTAAESPFGSRRGTGPAPRADVRRATNLNSHDCRVLLASAGDETPAALAPYIARRGWTCRRATSGGELCELARGEGFDLVVVQWPLPGPTLREVLVTLRYTGARTRDAPLVLIAPPDECDEVTAPHTASASVVLEAPCRGERVVRAIEGVCRIAPRVVIRTPAMLEVPRPLSRRRLLCQVENLSETGMLLRAGCELAPGETFDFDLHLPGDSWAVRGVGEVVRSARRPRDPVDGLGVRFVDLHGDAGERVTLYVASRLADDVR